MNGILKNIIGVLLAIFLLVCIIVGVDFIFLNKNKDKTQNDASQQVTEQVNPQNTEAQKKSKDISMANEMTNAIERFTSEYELFTQSIASNSLDFSSLDSAQGRVFNVTGADSREDIELLESTGLNGKQINRDTKYPTNVTTMQSLIENYMKTSSTTFTPKQSDCHYYYSPDCGVVICTETAKSSVTDLNKLIQSGKDAKGNTLGAETQWIDMTLGSSSSSSETIVGSATFNDGVTLSWTELQDPENGTKYGYNASMITDTEIGERAFNDCWSLTNVVIPDSVTSIGNGAFSGCFYLTSIVIPNGVNHIGKYAFSECSSLISIDIPDGVTEIGESTFYQCASLTNIVIPDNVTTIGNGAFSQCYSLISITISQGVTEIGGSAFSACSNLASITIPDSVTSIGEMAFFECYSLTNVTIPDSVTSIGNFAFGTCSNLTSITFEGTMAQWNAIPFSLTKQLFTSIYTPVASTIPIIHGFSPRSTACTYLFWINFDITAVKTRLRTPLAILAASSTTSINYRTSVHFSTRKMFSQRVSQLTQFLCCTLINKF